jgi:hypothetical protein
MHWKSRTKTKDKPSSASVTPTARTNHRYRVLAAAASLYRSTTMDSFVSVVANPKRISAIRLICRSSSYNVGDTSHTCLFHPRWKKP